MKTEEQLKIEIKNYINKSSEHLFTINDKQLMKVIPFTKDGIDYIYQVYFGNDYVRVDKKIIYDKQMLQHSLFPVYVKTKSIPYFKRMREIIRIIEDNVNKLDIKELETLIKPMLNDLMVVA